MNQFIKMGVTFTIAFLGLWLIMLTRGYDYFIAWKDIMIGVILALWIISAFGYVVYGSNYSAKKIKVRI